MPDPRSTRPSADRELLLLRPALALNARGEERMPARRRGCASSRVPPRLWNRRPSLAATGSSKNTSEMQKRGRRFAAALASLMVSCLALDAVAAPPPGQELIFPGAAWEEAPPESQGIDPERLRAA